MSAQWIFGYGSLIWRPDFEYQSKEKAYIRGWQRRFWQASPDHRGTETSPGRVVTLVASTDTDCWGTAYKIDGDTAPAVLSKLDRREQAGYVQVRTTLYVDGIGPVEDVLVYVADRDDENYLGDTPIENIAEVISRSHGPSGSNRDYLSKLAKALKYYDIEDPHVEQLNLLVNLKLV
ncbi:MAG: gamma-glutamylcyclotransferase [Kofleriaceae bacterium]|nr:gamma-glutamylcyclotransferase [Kofleriaceae bacterium]